MAIRQQITTVTNVSPQADTRVQLVNGNQNWNTSVRGVSPEYVTLKNWPVVSGGMFTEQHIERAAPVCVLGQTVAVIALRRSGSHWQTIRVQGLPCAVIGVLGIKGQTATGQDQDDTFLMPYTTVMKKIKGTPWLDDILMSALSADLVDRGSGAADRIAPCASSHPARRAGRLQPPQSDGDRPDRCRIGTDHGSAAGQRRLGVAAGRRRRHHEHHAGVGDRADARDRPAPGGRRAEARRAAPVPLRSGAAQPSPAARSACCWEWSATRAIAEMFAWPTRVSQYALAAGVRRLPPRSACSSAITRPAGRRGSTRSTPCATNK